MNMDERVQLMLGEALVNAEQSMLETVVAARTNSWRQVSIQARAAQLFLSDLAAMAYLLAAAETESTRTATPPPTSTTGGTKSPRPTEPSANS